MALHTVTPCSREGSLVFLPIGSAAKCTNGSFLPDVEGDYEIGDARWQAMQLPPRMGPASSPVRFSDHFQRTQTPSSAEQLLDTDSRMHGWQVVGQPHCTGTSNGSLMLQCAASSSANSANGVETTTVLPSNFAEPLSLVLSGVRLKNPAASVAAAFGELTLLVSTRRATVVPTAMPSRTIAFAELPDTSCAKHGVTATMHANSANCSVQIQCTSKAPQPPQLWNAQGVPHDVHCRDVISSSYDCGARPPQGPRCAGWFCVSVALNLRCSCCQVAPPSRSPDTQLPSPGCNCELTWLQATIRCDPV